MHFLSQFHFPSFSYAVQTLYKSGFKLTDFTLVTSGTKDRTNGSTFGPALYKQISLLPGLTLCTYTGVQRPHTQPITVSGWSNIYYLFSIPVIVH